MKKLSVELLHTVKSRIMEMHNWTEKPETQAIVGKIIHDTLYEQLPEPYSFEDIDTYSKKLYQYVCERYPFVAA